MAELIKVFKRVKEEEVTLSFNQNFLKVGAGDVSYQCKLIDAPYPDYNRILPKTDGANAKIPVEDLRKSFNRCVALADGSAGRSHPIHMDFTSVDAMVKISSTNKNDEDYNEDIPVTLQNSKSGVSLDLKFNLFYLIDIFKVLTDTSIVINMTDASSSILIQSDQDSSPIDYIVMPLKHL